MRQVATLEAGWRVPAGSLCEGRPGEGGVSLCCEVGEALEFTLELEVRLPAGKAVRVHSAEYVCVASWGDGGALQLALAPEILKARPAPPEAREGFVVLRLERRGAMWRLTEGEVVWLEVADPLPAKRLGEFEVFLPPGSEVAALTLRVAHEQPVPALPLATKPPMLAACIDFYDDLMLATWGPEQVRGLMRFYRERGIGKVYFVYHYRNASGFWRQPGRDREAPGFQDRIDTSFAAIGEVLPAFVQAAHEAGLPLYAVFKPFEGGFNATFPKGSPEAAQHGRIPMLGGQLWWATDALVEMQRLRVERKPTSAQAPHLLRLAPANPAALEGAASRLVLHASSDNGRYTLLEEGRDYVATLCPSGLEVRFRKGVPPFLSLEMRPGLWRFGGVLGELVQLETESGTPVEMTLGSRPNIPLATWRPEGFGFCFGSPKPGQPGSLRDIAWLDAGVPLGVAVGGERFVAGALSPAYPQVRAYWLELVEECLAAGVDGVDLRIKNHNRMFDPWNYGFEAPVREAYLQETGVDIWAAPDFDQARLRRLRGRFYSTFVEEAAARIHRAGRKLAVHIENQMHPSAWHSEMETEYAWHDWLARGWVDQITCKMFRTLSGGIAREAIAAAREHGVRVAVNPSLYATAQGNEWLARYWKEALRTGADEFILYENCLFAEPRGEGGQIVCTQPWLFEQLQRA